MICLELNWFFYDTSWMDANICLLIDATDRCKISSDQPRIFFDVSLYPPFIICEQSRLSFTKKLKSVNDFLSNQPLMLINHI